MTRERGSGTTPPLVVELLKKEVSEKSILAVSRATGLGLAAIGRYLKGIGEPTTKTLQKLSDYFGIPVTELRGEISLENAIQNINSAHKLLFEAFFSLKDKGIKSSKNPTAQFAKALYMFKVSGMNQEDIQETISAVDKLIDTIESEGGKQDHEEIKKEFRSELKKLNIDVQN